MKVTLTAALGAALLAIEAAAQPAAPVFRVERPIAVDGTGPRRLPIDVPLLSTARPFNVVRSDAGRRIFSGGAADLRLFDADGVEVPHLLVAPPARQPSWVRPTLLAVAPVETTDEKTSGFEADLGEPTRVDAIEVSVPTPFLKRVRLEGSGDRAHWTLLVAEGTLFDLPQENLRQTILSFAPGAYQYLRLTWDDTRSGRVQALSARVRLATPAAAIPSVLAATLAFERRPSEPGRSRFRVRLPGARLPIVALTLDVGGAHLLRPIRVYEARLSGGVVVPQLLGTGALRRVIQNDVVASALRVEIAPPSEAQLDLDVDDGDNGPLELRSVAAEFGELPWIYFESTGADLVARYGNQTLGSPRYDLEAVRPELKIDEVRDAAWGDPRPRPESETEPAEAPVPTAGAPIDVGQFRYLREIPAGAPALVRLSLDAAVLAHTSARAGPFADVRIVDRSSHQVPYLVEHATEPLSIDVALEPASAPPGLTPVAGGRSSYRVRLPYETLPAFRFVLSTSARVFTRRVSIVVPRRPDSHHRGEWSERLVDAAWTHGDELSQVPALTLSIQPFGGADLFVIVDEGDNSALPLTSARILLPAYRLRFFRTRDASLRLAYGRDDLDRPQYDLALLAPRLLGAPALDVDAAREVVTTASGGAVEVVSPKLFWTVLAIAVVALLGLIARLIRRDTEPGAPVS